MKLGRILALQLVVWPAALLAVELGYRGWLAARGDGYSAAAAAERLDRALEGIDRDAAAFTVQADGPEAQAIPQAQPNMVRAVTHPYWGWSFPRFDQRFARDLPLFEEDAIELLVLGGSVAQAFHGYSERRLRALLSADPRYAGRELRALSLSSGGFKQPQQVGLLNYALSRGWRPELVINLDGFNELALGAQNWLESGVHPLHPSFFLWGPTATSRQPGREHLDRLVEMRGAQQRAGRLRASAERWSLTASAVLGRWTERRLGRVVSDYERAYGAYTELVAADAQASFLTGPDFDGDFDDLLAELVSNWKQSSLSLHGLCQARGMTYIHVLQPTLLDEGSKPLTPAELEAGRAPEAWVRSVREGYPLLRAAGAELRAQGVTFFDASRVFESRSEDIYIDPCHFEQDGNDLLAEAVAAFMLQ